MIPMQPSKSEIRQFEQQPCQTHPVLARAKFASSILGEWGEKPFTDIMRGTDYRFGKVPNAAAGASYGGYMAAWVLAVDHELLIYRRSGG